MKKILLTLLAVATLLTLTSCGEHPNELVSVEPVAEAEVTIFYPDGTTETFDVLDYGSGRDMRIYFTKMDGVDYAVTLPSIVKMKH